MPFPEPTDASGLAEIADGLKRAGIAVSRHRGDQLVVDGVPLHLNVRRMAVVTPTTARGLPKPGRDMIGVVVADRVSDEARRELAARGWGWLDRRGHLRVWANGLRIATEVEPTVTTPPRARFASVFPPVGIEVALTLLKEPLREWTVRDVAAAVGRAAGGVSERLRALRDAGLVDRRNQPMRPELFWELVGAWHVGPTGLASFPGLTGAFDQLAWLGLPTDWVLTDTQAALFLGAPLVASGEGPPDFYLPRPIVDLALAHFGPSRGVPAATVRSIRYAGIRDAEPFRTTSAGFRVAHPVVVALDLAHDRARGREIVEAWDPSPVGVEHVW